MVVLDCFADRDTAAAAVACRAVPAGGAPRLDRGALLAAASQLIPSARCAGLVCGSGFEGRPTLLRALAYGRRLYGNRPEVQRLVKDPERFFPLLDRLGIPHPETRMRPPRASGGWLVKSIGGAGGTHIRSLDATVARPGRVYFQRQLPGASCSVLFLADGARARVLGWNRQWTTPAIPGLPYLFGGAVGGVPLPAVIIRAVTAAVEELVRETGLVGLNGLDFLVHRHRWSVLEVNPRPTATVELYDPDSPRGLFDWHLAACDGRLPDQSPRPRACRAVAIVHAPVEWTAGDFVFPTWCRDLPPPTTTFSARDPVCTVHASAPDPDRAVRLVQDRRRRLETLIARTRTAAAV